MMAFAADVRRALHDFDLRRRLHEAHLVDEQARVDQLVRRQDAAA